MTNKYIVMSNININVSISLDKTVLATLVGLLGGSLGDGKEEQPAVTAEPQKEDKEEVNLDSPSKFDEWKQAHPALGMLCDKLELELTDESVPRFVRQAMENCRLRIEGEGYTKESPHHKELTAEFKRLASLLGAEKPSALPLDKVEPFIDALEKIHLSDDKLALVEDDLPF